MTNNHHPVEPTTAAPQGDNLVLFQELPINWKLMLGIGIFMILAGSLGIGMSIYLTLGSMLLFGILLAAGGVMQFFDGLQSKEENWAGRTQHFLVALFYLLAAAAVIWDPLAASFLITVLLAGLFTVIGSVKIWYAFHCKKRGWQWILPFVSGGLNIALATLIIISLPESSLWLLGILIAIELLLNGWFLTFVALRVKQNQR